MNIDESKCTHRMIYRDGSFMQITEGQTTPATEVFREVHITDEQAQLLEALCDVEYDSKGERWYKLNAQYFRIGLILKMKQNDT